MWKVRKEICEIIDFPVRLDEEPVEQALLSANTFLKACMRVSIKNCFAFPEKAD